MVYRAVFPRNVFSELNRLQHDFWQSLDANPNIRGSGRGGFPPINVGSSERAVDIYVFAPGLDPATIDAQIEKGVLTISGERNVAVPNKDEQATMHIAERFTGRFRRVVSLPDDIDPSAVSAKYRDGLLHVGVARREAAQPRRIAVQ